MLRQLTVLYFPALAVAALVPLSGCGETRGQSPSLIHVTGRVTYKGTPVTKGSVWFEPEGFGRSAKGQLQSDGSFVLGTFREGDGVVAGAHRISISGFEKPLAKDRALKKYGSLNTSGLTAEVDADHIEFSFELK